MSATDSPDTMEFVTIFDEFLKVFDYRLNTETSRTFKSDHYPKNVFVLSCRSNGSTVYVNLRVNGPQIQNATIKISKQDLNYVSYVPSGTLESKELKLDGQQNYSWSFSTSQGYTYTENTTNYAIRTVWIKIEISVPIETQEMPAQVPADVEARNKLCATLFDNPTYNKFKIHVQDKTFYVSEFVLAMNSPFFKTKLLELAKKQEEGLRIDEFDEKVVEKMLKFAYNNQEELGSDFNFVEQLTLASGKYGFDVLKESCEKILLENVNSSTAPRYFEIAHKYKCSQLRQKCVDYLKTKFPEFRQNEEFEALLKNYQLLVLEICYSGTGFNEPK